MPVLGYPWSAPLEFPLYQFIVAKIVQLTGYKLDVVGRSTSLFFYYFCLLPIVLIVRKYGQLAILISIALYLTSPIELMYSRSFLIENFALFFSLLTFAVYIGIRRYIISGTYFFKLLGILVITGSICGLQKITTFLPVFLICFADSLTFYKLKKFDFKSNKRIILVSISLGISIFPALVYSKYSDSIKVLGHITEYLLILRKDSQP